MFMVSIGHVLSTYFHAWHWGIVKNGGTTCKLQSNISEMESQQSCL